MERGWTGEMAQVKALAAKPGKLSLITGIHMVEAGIGRASSDLHVCTLTVSGHEHT